MIPLTFVLAVVAGTLSIGVWGVRFARTTSDLYVASRSITPWWNAAAVSGEYLSAASFLGIAGLVMTTGASALWQPIGFTAGYLALLLFVAAPLRRYGAYTISDFAEARLESPRMRLLAAAVVIGIDVLYLLPQLKGAGITVRAITGANYWVGILVVGGTVAVTVSLGGMRGITYVQAYQFWVKVVAIALPVIVLLAVVGVPRTGSLFSSSYPHAARGGLTLQLKHPAKVTFPVAAHFSVNGIPYTARAGVERVLPAGRLRLPAGTAIPVAAGTTAHTGAAWSRPVSHGAGESSPLFVYSLLIATFLGTMGLPHILVRFYTNPDGHAARHTTVNVLGLLGLFYTFPAVYGILGRLLAPSLYITGDTDSVVLKLPQLVWPGLGGTILGGVTAAGAFAAFMSTSSGLLVSLAGTISYDIWPRIRRGDVSHATRRRRFRIAAVSAIVAPLALALLTQHIAIAVLVGWAFALAASTFCPLFVLGIWWRRLSVRGAAIGVSAGAVLTLVAIAVDLGRRTTGYGAVDALLTQPALLSVPAAFVTMILGSLFCGGAKIDATSHMRALHTPESSPTALLRQPAAQTEPA